jgi:hypothetical protein
MGLTVEPGNEFEQWGEDGLVGYVAIVDCESKRDIA